MNDDIAIISRIASISQPQDHRRRCDRHDRPTRRDKGRTGGSRIFGSQPQYAQAADQVEDDRTRHTSIAICRDEPDAATAITAVA